MSSLTQEILGSLSGYAAATRWERRCLYAIAARTRPIDLEKYQPAFQEITHGDRWITKADLAEAFMCAQRWCFTYSLVDADAFFWAADLDGDAVLSFTEFVAACLYSHLGPLDGWLAQEAFESMDKDGDGLLRASDVIEIFGELPPGLPTHRAFNVDEWCVSLLRNRPQYHNGAEKVADPAPSTFWSSLLGGCQQHPEENDVFVDAVPSYGFALEPSSLRSNYGNRTNLASSFEPRPRSYLSSPSYTPKYMLNY